MKIQVIMPMAGQAERFNRESDSIIIKPLIEINDVPLFHIAMSSLTNMPLEFDLYFVVQENHLSISNLGFLIKSLYPSAKTLPINKKTNGPAETLNLVIQDINTHSPVIVIDCDLSFRSKALQIFLNTLPSDIDTALLTFHSQKPHYSFIKTKDGQVKEIKEKELISEEAVCGCYYFKSAILLQALIAKAHQRITNREIFISDLIQESIREGLNCRALPCDFHLSLGTPEEIQENTTLIPF